VATIAILGGGLLMAFGIGWVGIQGLRGIPDSNGKMTPKGTAIAAVVLALLILSCTWTVCFF
jgi:hypothetical protein